MIIIGDVHGEIDKYVDLTLKYSTTFQLGDFGWKNHLNRAAYLVDTSFHKIGQGNHDDHDAIQQYPGFVGRFAILPEFFWIGGGHSIDSHERRMEWMTTGIRTWWSNEELNLFEMRECTDLYTDLKPDVVVSHECPQRINDLVSPNRSLLSKLGYHSDWSSITSQYLDNLLRIHQPRLWIFGHHHRKYEEVVDKTRFVCLPKLGTFDLEKESFI